MKEYYLNPNRKKIRGWKRRIKQINFWGEYIKQPYTTYFANGGDSTYERCIIYPFYTLNKRQPPIWFSKLIVDKFITAYYEWEKAFDKLNIPYDLQLQLYDPNFMWSEIICRRVEKQGDTISYAWESEEQKPLPYNRFANNDSRLKQLNWIFADEQAVIFESELEEENLKVEDLFAEGYIAKDSGKNGVYYAKKIGDMWIGRKK